ncbi:hypothetical protein [Streptomyces sp. NPDC056661]|uniref:hypothetical protein n=1 Tax=Streptomyces sp. NPDC056661 TaxID=3345898 RepID=UPI0036B9ECA9
MAETAFFRGEGGAVWEMDLPLGSAHQRDVELGRLIQVDPEGSAFTEPATEPDPQEPAKKPNKASSKADWVAWAVQQGAEQEEAESLTLAALIERFHSAE